MTIDTSPINTIDPDLQLDHMTILTNPKAFIVTTILQAPTTAPSPQAHTIAQIHLAPSTVPIPQVLTIALAHQAEHLTMDIRLHSLIEDPPISGPDHLVPYHPKPDLTKNVKANLHDATSTGVQITRMDPPEQIPQTIKG